MAKDDLQKDFQGINEELILLNDQLSSIGNNIKSKVGSQVKNLSEEVQNVAKSFSNDLTKAINRSKDGLDRFSNIQSKIAKGQNASKDIEKEIAKVQKERQTTLRKLELKKKWS